MKSTDMQPNHRIRIIEWQQDVHGQEPEVLEGKKPLPAVPQGSDSLTLGFLAWAYKKGEKTRVVIKDQNSQEYCFLDVEHGHQISGIPHKAFRFLDRVAGSVENAQ